MTDNQQARLAELQELCRSNPAAVIALYRDLAGLNENDRLPPELTPPKMIQLIVAKESAVVALDCPLCGHKGRKEVILRRPWTGASGPPQPELPFFACPSCQAEYPVPATV